jgi:hypothetical protein
MSAALPCSRATIVEELDNVDVACRVAAYRGCGIIENLVCALPENLCRLGIRFAFELVLGAAQRLDQNVGFFSK